MELTIEQFTAAIEPETKIGLPFTKNLEELDAGGKRRRGTKRSLIAITKAVIGLIQNDQVLTYDLLTEMYDCNMAYLPSVIYKQRKYFAEQGYKLKANTYFECYDVKVIR